MPERQTTGFMVSVVVPTYRRPTQLRSCVDGVLGQTRAADEIIVVHRDEDAESQDVVREFGDQIRSISVSRPGQVAALLAGSRAASGDIVAFVDDDAVPKSDWLERLLIHFADPRVAAVGGRDIVHHGTEIESGHALVVGQLSRCGKPIGNHHIGTGKARSVDFLKGCNCAYRKEELALPDGLRGRGAQTKNDMATSLRIRALGLGVIYDPGVLVDHYPGARFDSDKRDAVTLDAQLDTVYNEAYTVCSLLPHIRWRYLFYHIVVGHKSTPGLIRSTWAWIHREKAASGRLAATVHTLWSGYRESTLEPLKFSR